MGLPTSRGHEKVARYGVSISPQPTLGAFAADKRVDKLWLSSGLTRGLQMVDNNTISTSYEAPSGDGSGLYTGQCLINKRRSSRPSHPTMLDLDKN